MADLGLLAPPPGFYNLLNGFAHFAEPSDAVWYRGILVLGRLRCGLLGFVDVIGLSFGASLAY